MQVPPRQAPLWVQRLPSSHAVRSASVVCVQPVAGSQPSAVQLLPSLQLGGGPPTQLPPAQVSAVVQALPSSHAAVLFVCVQPVAGSQASVVQTLPSSQLGGGPPAQLPAPSQGSAVVQALLSVQAMVVKRVTGQFPWPSHVVLVVQGFPSSQAVVADVKVQLALQQLPGWPLAAPRSQSSLRSTKLLPQSSARRPTTLLNRPVCMPPTGRSGPSTLNRFVPQALPVTVWSAAPVPIVPGAGGTGPARNVRKGPTSPLRASPNASGTRPIFRVKSMRRGGTPSALIVSTPKGWVTV